MSIENKRVVNAGGGMAGLTIATYLTRDYYDELLLGTGMVKAILFF